VIKRVLLAVVAVAALTAAVATVVVAAAFALYAVLRDDMGEPGAAAVVAVVFALILAVAGLIAGLMAKGRRPQREPSLTERLSDFARERPLLAAGGALAAGLLALKNPQAATGLVSAFLASKAADKAGHRKRGR
jgi:uncharacterized PurR-regulated membrane protein YhhQ (DUF165 family)